MAGHASRSYGRFIPDVISSLKMLLLELFNRLQGRFVHSQAASANPLPVSLHFELYIVESLWPGLARLNALKIFTERSSESLQQLRAHA